MSTSPSLVRDHALPARFAVLGGVTQACSVGGLALMTLGQGIAAWALMMAGCLLAMAAHLHWRQRVDGRPLGTSLGAAGVVLGLVALLVVGALVARSVVVGTPWLAALVALATGAATAGVLRWWQLRPVFSPV